PEPPQPAHPRRLPPPTRTPPPSCSGKGEDKGAAATSIINFTFTTTRVATIPCGGRLWVAFLFPEDSRKDGQLREDYSHANRWLPIRRLSMKRHRQPAHLIAFNRQLAQQPGNMRSDCRAGNRKLRSNGFIRETTMHQTKHL